MDKVMQEQGLPITPVDHTTPDRYLDRFFRLKISDFCALHAPEDEPPIGDFRVLTTRSDKKRRPFRRVLSARSAQKQR